MYIGHARLCVGLHVCLYLSLAEFPHYCKDRDVTWRMVGECPLLMHHWADLQSLYGFRCYDSHSANAKCQRVLVLVVCLICGSRPAACGLWSVIVWIVALNSFLRLLSCLLLGFVRSTSLKLVDAVARE